MARVIFSDDQITILEKQGKWFVRYDAGSHQIVMREDEISQSEALALQSDPGDATKVLFAVQRRISERGEDPYVATALSDLD